MNSNDISYLALFIIITVLSVFLLMSLAYEWSNGKLFKHIFHDIFNWHLCNIDSANWHGGDMLSSKCIICHKRCLRDSQGNWF